MKIPPEVKEFIENQAIFAVGSIGTSKFANVSPRIFIHVTDNEIYWLDFFKHKSYRNFKINPWVTISVFDKEELKGYQIRGKVSFLTDEKEKSKIRQMIIERTLDIFNSEKIKKLSQKEAEVILFEPKMIYSLIPEEFSDLSIASETDVSRIF